MKDELISMFSDHLVMKLFIAATFWLVADQWTALIAVGLLSIIDFVTGTIYGVKTVGFSSSASARGALKRGSYVIVLTSALLFDKISPAPFATVGAACWVGATEIISIFENLYKLGYPVPLFLIKQFKVFKDGQK